MRIDTERLVPGKKKDAFYFEHIQRYRFASKYTKNKRVLDLGCGVGYGTNYLANHGAKEVVGVDIDPKAIEYARRKYEIRNTKFEAANAEVLTFSSNSFDVVVSFEVIEHVKSFKKSIKEVSRVLKPNGLFIFSTPNRLGIRGGTSPYHTKEFTASELRKLFPGVKLYGQFIKNKKFLEQQSEYFKRYQKLTAGGNKFLKKLIHLIPANIKSVVYKSLWHAAQVQVLKEGEIEIRRGNLTRAITLIGVIQWPRSGKDSKPQKQTRRG